jgi:hypothetical protein
MIRIKTKPKRKWSSMKLVLTILCCFSFSYCATDTLKGLAIDTQEIREAMALNTDFSNRQYNGMKIHKSLAYTTGGLLLLSDALGAYHFFSMRRQGHDFRDSIGFSEENGDNTIKTREIKSIWGSSESQIERVFHASLISVSTICYVATATIELTLPRIDTDSSKFSRPNIHRGLFNCHAALMLANIGLGCAESYALSRGNHDLVMGLGITHMAVGIAAPVVMFGSGLAFK